jgi:hypothetical protein
MNRYYFVVLQVIIFIAVFTGIAFTSPEVWAEDGPALDWERSFAAGGIQANSVLQCADGGYIVVAGVCCSLVSSSDIYLIKYDNAGNKLWEKTIGTSGVQVGYSIAQTSDLGFIITGFSDSRVGSRELYLVRTDISGNVLWDKYYSEGYPNSGHCVRQTADGGYIAVGETLTQGLYINGHLVSWGPMRVYLVKTDAEGNKLWGKILGGAGENYGLSVEQTVNGEYIITGNAKITDSYGISHGQCVYLVKVDSLGNILWEKMFGNLPNGGGVEGRSVKQCADGGYIICGDNVYKGAAQQDIYLLRTDAYGDLLWDNHFGGENNDRGYDVCLTTDGGFVSVGSIFSPVSFNDVYLVKVDANGHKIWEKEIVGQYLDEGHSVQQTSDGGYIVGGSTQLENGGDYIAYLLKLKEAVKVTGSLTFQVAPESADIPQAEVSLWAAGADRSAAEPILTKNVDVTVTNDEGSFKLTGLAPGSYDITFKLPYSLRAVETNITITNDTMTPVNFGEITLGDTWGEEGPDNVVDVSDYSAILYSFGAIPGDEKYIDTCDLNRDGVVDVTDYSIVLYNFGKYGEAPF